MRLWTLHPKYLDRAGLLAVWREGLLAKSVLEQWAFDPSKPKGYRNHPQLIRFKESEKPVEAIQIYLSEILAESKRRHYHFDARKISVSAVKMAIRVTEGQIEYERGHLFEKLRKRDSDRAKILETASILDLNPLFARSPGGIEPWEKIRNHHSFSQSRQ